MDTKAAMIIINNDDEIEEFCSNISGEIYSILKGLCGKKLMNLVSVDAFRLLDGSETILYRVSSFGCGEKYRNLRKYARLATELVMNRRGFEAADDWFDGGVADYKNFVIA